MIFMDLSVIGVYFMAGMLYLERQEGSIQALITSPLGRANILPSKCCH